jgi:RNA polymerase sigma factor (TIGR02999 family)
MHTRSLGKPKFNEKVRQFFLDIVRTGTVPCGSARATLRLQSVCVDDLFEAPALSKSGDSQVTALLQAAQSGDRQATADLLPLVYAELHGLARARLARQSPGQTLQPTALVHEVYLRVAGDSDVTWEGRRHFFFAAARAMRDILVEQARRKANLKQGGDWRRQELDEACAVLEPPSDDVLAIHEALAELEEIDPVKAQIVLLRYFTGLTREETAALLQISERTLDRQWRFIRAWLLKRLS